MNTIDVVKQEIRKSPFAWTFFLLTLFLHILWPLTSGTSQAFLTTLAVITLALSSGFSAVEFLGRQAALTLVALISFVAFLIERLGSTTGFPFGDYSYTTLLQPQVFAVPIAVVLAWFAMAWVMCVFVSGTSLSILRKALLAGLLLTAWDFYLDPQMTTSGYWVWNSVSPDLPGIPGIPLTNYLGWLISGTAMSLIILWFIRNTIVNRFLSKIVLLWTIFGGFILHAVFWGNLPVGLWGLVTLGALWFTVERLTRVS